MNVWGVAAIAFLQVFLFCSHWFLYHTLVAFWPSLLPLSAEGISYLGGALYALSASFIVAALLGFRFSNGFVAFLYKFAASWLGIFNFFFWAACLCWIADFLAQVIGRETAHSARPWIGTFLFGAAILISLYGFINARLIQERRVTVTLPNLPESWKGRTALLISDLHLGNINAVGFSRRIAAIAGASIRRSSLSPAICTTVPRLTPRASPRRYSHSARSSARSSAAATTRTSAMLPNIRQPLRVEAFASCTTSAST